MSGNGRCIEIRGDLCCQCSGLCHSFRAGHRGRRGWLGIMVDVESAEHVNDVLVGSFELVDRQELADSE